MIILNINPSIRPLIKSKGTYIKVKDNLNHYFCSKLLIFFSNNSYSKMAVIDYDLLNGAGDKIRSITILNENKECIYRNNKVLYFKQNLDEYLLV